MSNLSESVIYLIDAEDRATAKFRENQEAIKESEKVSEKVRKRELNSAEAIIRKQRTELEVVKDKIKALQAYGRTSAKAGEESREAIHKLFVAHREEKKAIKEKAEEAKRAASASVAGAIIKSQRTELEVIKDKIKALRDYGKTSTEAGAESRTAIRKLIAAHREEQKAIKEKANEAKKVGKVKELTAASSELADVVDLLGGTNIGGFAGDLASAADQAGGLYEATKLAGKGGFLMKAGVVAATAAISFKLGKAIGDVIFKTERWRKENAAAMSELRDSASQTTNSLQRAFDTKLATINTISSKEFKNDSLEKMLSHAKVEADGAANNVKRLERNIKEMQSDSTLFFQSENHKANIETTKARLEISKQILATRREQKQQLEGMLSPAAKLLKRSQERFEAEKKSKDVIGDLQNEYELASRTGEERWKFELRMAGLKDKEMERALALKRFIADIAAKEDAAEKAKAKADLGEAERQRDLEDKRRKAANAREKAAADRLNEAKRLAGVYDSNIGSLKEQLIAVTKSKSAAAAFRLEMQGVGKDDARFLGGLKERIKTLQEASKKSSVNVGNNTAKDERLISGRASSAFAKTAEAIEAERQTKIQSTMEGLLTKLVEFEQKRKKVDIQVKGR